MDFPKLIEKKQKKETRRLPWTFIGWAALLFLLLFIARQISFNAVISPVTFAPRLIPNDSVVYNDSSIIRTSQTVSIFPTSLGSSNKAERLLRIVDLNGDQKYYVFTTDKTLEESFNFSRDFTKVKYLSGADYAFKLGDGIYVSQSGVVEKVYIQKTDETIEDYEYNSSERAFYVLLKQASQRTLVRIGAFGEQELFTLKKEYTSPIKLLDISGNVTIQDSLKVCGILDLSSKAEFLSDCINTKQNDEGINYYLKSNSVTSYNLNTLAESVVFTPDSGILYNLIKHDEQFGAVFSRSVVSLLTTDFVYISRLNQTFELPAGFNITDFYIIGTVIYITNGKVLFAQDTSQPVSSGQSSWQVVENGSEAVNVEFVY